MTKLSMTHRDRIGYELSVTYEQDAGLWEWTLEVPRLYSLVEDTIDFDVVRLRGLEASVAALRSWANQIDAYRQRIESVSAETISAQSAGK